MSRLYAVPINLKEAASFVESFHRHNRPPVGGLFAVGVSDGSGLLGVAIVGRPVARGLQDGYTAEVTRTCVKDDSPRNCNSFLYGACWRAARAMGYTKLVTYTLQSESGASLRGAGFNVVAEVAVRNNPWQGPDRSRDWQSVYGQLKFRWERR